MTYRHKVDAGLEKVHGGSVSEHVWMYSLRFQRRHGRTRFCEVLAEYVPHPKASKGLASAVAKYWLLGCRFESAAAQSCRGAGWGGRQFGGLCALRAEECEGAACLSCDDNNDCTTDTRVEPCHKACEHTPKRPNRTNIDECCPDGSNANEDADCVAECGNMVKEPGEMCDPCPACVETDPCIRMVESGSGCNLRCTPEARAPSPVADRCCPNPGGNANNDADCRPECGNGEVPEERDEVSSTCSDCKMVTSTPVPAP